MHLDHDYKKFLQAHPLIEDLFVYLVFNSRHHLLFISDLTNLYHFRPNEEIADELKRIFGIEVSPEEINRSYATIGWLEKKYHLSKKDIPELILDELKEKMRMDMYHFILGIKSDEYVELMHANDYEKLYKTAYDIMDTPGFIKRPVFDQLTEKEKSEFTFLLSYFLEGAGYSASDPIICPYRNLFRTTMTSVFGYSITKIETTPDQFHDIIIQDRGEETVKGDIDRMTLVDIETGKEIALYNFVKY